MRNGGMRSVLNQMFPENSAESLVNVPTCTINILFNVRKHRQGSMELSVFLRCSQEKRKTNAINPKGNSDLN